MCVCVYIYCYCLLKYNHSKTVVCQFDKRGKHIIAGTNKGHLYLIDVGTRKVKKKKRIFFFLYWNYICILTYKLTAVVNLFRLLILTKLVIWLYVIYQLVVTGSMLCIR